MKATVHMGTRASDGVLYHGQVGSQGHLYLPDFSMELGQFALGDSGCNSSVCGDLWLDRYKRRAKVHGLKWFSAGSGQNFGFGGDHNVQSLGAFIIQVVIRGYSHWLRVDVICGTRVDEAATGKRQKDKKNKSSMPFLLSEKAMATLGIDMILTQGCFLIKRELVPVVRSARRTSLDRFI